MHFYCWCFSPFKGVYSSFCPSCNYIVVKHCIQGFLICYIFVSPSTHHLVLVPHMTYVTICQFLLVTTSETTFISHWQEITK